MSTSDAGPASATRPRRGFGRPSDMVRSLAVVFVFVAAILILTPRPHSDTVRTVDWKSAYAQAVLAADYPLYGPADLPAGWRATSARTSKTVGGGTLAWHVGFVTPSDAYAAVEQSDGEPAAFIADMTTQGRPQGDVEVAGSTWQRLLRHKGDQDYRSLVRSTNISTVVLAGNASYAELEQLAAALRPE